MYTVFNVQTQEEVIGVMFKEETFAGMVGESVYMISAWEIKDSDSGVPEIGRQLQYEDLCGLYKHIESKKERISFWKFMREFTEKRITEREIEQTAEAVRLVI